MNGDEVKHTEFSEDVMVLAKRYFDEHRISEIQFSGGTYQARVSDLTDQADVWCFLQLDDEGKIGDCFCSCDQEKCEHLAASLLSIYGQYSVPLHVRFARSLWNNLCLIYMQKVGAGTDALKQVEDSKYECYSSTGKKVFVLQLKNEEAVTTFRSMIENRVRETEETSLKFSKLSPEEIARWKEGRPSLELRYELSFWSDLAKWLMRLQDKGEPCTIHFSYDQNGLPNGIDVLFPQIELRCYISEANLEQIIPALASVKTPLAVHSSDEELIDFVSYNEANSTFDVHIHNDLAGRKVYRAEERKNHLGTAYPIGEWLYVKEDGFYPKEQNYLIAQRHLSKEEIANALNKHGKLIERYLVGTKIFRDFIGVSYKIHFDSEWNLHLIGYLFEPDDLMQPGAAFFKEWAYIPGQGFYPLTDVLFETVEEVIPFENVSDFISKNRGWFNTQEGFHTHLASVDAHLTYSLNSEHILHFGSHTDILDSGMRSKDFGDWVYVEGEGFYAKRHGRLSAAVQPGVEVKPGDIPLFIHLYQDELEHVQGFFSKRSPIIKVGVNIKLNADETIYVTPFYHLYPEYNKKELIFFEDVVYVEGEGFHQLPLETRLPKRFRKEIVISKDQIPFFISHELDTLIPYAASIDPRLKKPKGLTLVITDLKRLPDGTLDVKMSYKSDLGEVSLEEISDGFSTQRRYLFSRAGLVDLEHSMLQWLKQLHRDGRNLSHDFSLSTLDIFKLQATQEMEAQFESTTEGQASEALWNALCTHTAEVLPDYSALNSHLRPYQETGVRWLWFLYFHGLAGLLCDDMGLGKTHQAMALLAAVDKVKRANEEVKKAKYLIVCPTSVIYHWEDKLAQYLPGFKVYTFYGIHRTLDGFLRDGDILLTSYGVLRMEKEVLSKQQFEVAIYDEVQVAKNHLSLTHKALLAIKSKMRIGLTGTPIENRLRELKSLFDVVLPSYMPSEVQYREQFVSPIEKQQEPKAKELLGRLINPFVLRRKKSEVLRDLPEKTEERAYCDLSADQERLYREAMDQAKKGVVELLQDNSKPIPYLPLFALLTKLKQICDHPAVSLGKPQEYEKYQSGKWDLFLELLNEARESEQKVVVFTHYLAMMDIIENYLRANNIGYGAIRGATVNRREEIRRFQEQPECEVFIASLQAAGLGVDLTAGSVVIHYDRWWNAARENQATDRVHRIGQQRGVQVFKLITKNTLEQYIDHLIEKKGQMMEDIVGSDDENQLKLLNREEWLELLRLITE